MTRATPPGASENTPDRDKWLKQFTGLPEDDRPTDLHIEHPEIRPLVQAPIVAPIGDAGHTGDAFSDSDGGSE